MNALEYHLRELTIDRLEDSPQAGILRHKLASLGDEDGGSHVGMDSNSNLQDIRWE